MLIIRWFNIGTELISPDDLLKAAALCGPSNLGLSLREFESGVKVVQLSDYSEDNTCEKIVELLQIEPGSASSLAAKLDISIVVAKEFLLMAERRGRICRDESYRGLHFYLNCFK